MTSFDRLRSRTPDVGSAASTDYTVPSDTAGRRALFSAADADGSVPFGAVNLACSRCGEHSVLSPRQFLRNALPSLHLPGIKRGHPSWMRCPACGHRTWTRLSFTV